MVDAMVNSVEDYLIDGLSFKFSPGASYVTDRRSVSFFTAGSNSYTPGAGTRVARINLTGDGWLDPSTVRVMYTLVNTATGASAEEITNKILRPISGPWSFFRRARCMVGGAIVDDVDYYNRVHEMLHILTSEGNRNNDDIEGFGLRWDDNSCYKTWTDKYNEYFKGGTSKKVSFKPFFGLLNQPKYIPLSWCPLTIEMEIVNNATDAVCGNGGAFTDANTSKSWLIQDVRIVCDVVTLDSALQNSYAEHVLSGKALPINYSTYISQYQTAIKPEINVNVTRTASRLKSVFINFDGPHGEADISDAVHKSFNTFMSPSSGNTYMAGQYEEDEELQWQLQIGSKLFPEYPCRSIAETFYQLRKSLGIHGSAFHSVNINLDKFMNDHYIIGIDTEKIIEPGFIGLNTRAGDLMVFRAKGDKASLASWNVNSVYIILHTDQILEIRDTGSQVFD